MISVYTPNDIDYEKNGSAVLLPTKCTVTENAGGSYEVALEHPVSGPWALLDTGNIIKVPVPVAGIESAIAGESVDVWRAKSNAATIYAKPDAPSGIRYPEWSYGIYPVGSKVSIYGDPGVGKPFQGNYQKIAMAAEGSMDEYDWPPYNATLWKSIGGEHAGAAVIAKLTVGTEVFVVEEYSDAWLYVQTPTGYQGYVQRAYMEFVRTEEVREEPERVIRDQLFRIYDVQVATDKKSVSVKARHVSYDYAGQLVGPCVLNNVNAPVAISRMRAALMGEYENTVATTLDDDDGTITATYTYKNPVSCLLDPDSGIVPTFRARLIRDNWDFFIYKNREIDRGLRLEYGKNLRGVTWKRNTDKLINRVIPVAQKADGSDLFLPEVWVDSPIFDSYPAVRVEYLKVDGKIGEDDGQDGTWTEETLLEHMRETAQARFDKDNVDKVSVEIKANFTLLGDTEEYAQYRSLQKLLIYDTVEVSDRTVELRRRLQVVKTEWDPILSRYNSITLGSVFDVHRTVAGYNITDGCIRYNKLSRDAIDKLKAEVTANA